LFLREAFVLLDFDHAIILPASGNLANLKQYNDRVRLEK
jgi:hypothetical protein